MTINIFLRTDNESPVITNIPADISHNTDNGLLTAIVNWREPTATDNSGIQTLTSTHSPGSTFDIGVTIVSYTSVDSVGHKTTKTFSITVEGICNVCSMFCINGSQLAKTYLRLLSLQVSSYFSHQET